MKFEKYQYQITPQRHSYFINYITYKYYILFIFYISIIFNLFLLLLVITQGKVPIGFDLRLILIIYFIWINNLLKIIRQQYINS